MNNYSNSIKIIILISIIVVLYISTNISKNYFTTFKNEKIPSEIATQIDNVIENKLIEFNNLISEINNFLRYNGDQLTQSNNITKLNEYSAQLKSHITIVINEAIPILKYYPTSEVFQLSIDFIEKNILPQYLNENKSTNDITLYNINMIKQFSNIFLLNLDNLQQTITNLQSSIKNIQKNNSMSEISTELNDLIKYDNTLLEILNLLTADMKIFIEFLNFIQSEISHTLPPNPTPVSKKMSDDQPLMSYDILIYIVVGIIIIFYFNKK